MASPLSHLISRTLLSTKTYSFRNCYIPLENNIKVVRNKSIQELTYLSNPLNVILHRRIGSHTLILSPPPLQEVLLLLCRVVSGCSKITQNKQWQNRMNYLNPRSLGMYSQIQSDFRKFSHTAT